MTDAGDAEIEALVARFGEEHRRLIVDAIEFLREREPEWGVTIERAAYIRNLVHNAVAPDIPPTP